MTNSAATATASAASWATNPALVTQRAAAQAAAQTAPATAPRIDITPENEDVSASTSLSSRTGIGGPQAQDGTLTFQDVVDTINPLQQLPIVSTIYRAVTGNKISGVAQVAGSALYGGPLGMIGGVISAMFEEATGHSISETLVAAVTGEKLSAPAAAADAATNTQTADATAATPTDSKTAAAKPAFGGIMDTGTETAPTSAAQYAAAANAAAPSAAAITPVTAKNLTPVSTSAGNGGSKFYSLAGITRRGSAPAAMPMPELRNPTLKAAAPTLPVANAAATRATTLNAQAEAVAGTSLPSATPTGFFSSNDNEEDAPSKNAGGLGLSAPGFATNSSAPTTPGGNPLPPELVQDLMRSNLEKYQTGLNTGEFRGNQVSVLR